MKKVLLFGANGFLGKNLKQKFLYLNYQVDAPNKIDCDMLNYNDFLYFKDWKYDYIINCAVIYTKDPFVNLVHESILNLNFMRFCVDYQKQAKLICFGSDICYDDNFQKEDGYLDNNSEEKSGKYNEYIIVKKNLLRALYLSKMNFNYYVLTSMFGPNFILDDFHLIPSLIKEIDEKEIIYSNMSGEEKRQVLFVDDVVENIINSLDQNLGLINLGTKNILMVKDLIKKIQFLMNKKQPVLYSIIDVYHSKQMKFDTAIYKIKNYSDTYLDFSLRKTINYYEKIRNQK
jgi:nucleoside-diphosphate-sugar epimerase